MFAWNWIPGSVVVNKPGIGWWKKADSSESLLLWQSAGCVLTGPCFSSQIKVFNATTSNIVFSVVLFWKKKCICKMDRNVPTYEFSLTLMHWGNDAQACFPCCPSSVAYNFFHFLLLVVLINLRKRKRTLKNVLPEALTKFMVWKIWSDRKPSYGKREREEKNAFK